MRVHRCGPELKPKATGRVFGYRRLQVECFKRNVAPRAIEADIFEISVCEPVIHHSVTGPILQHQQEESLSRCLVSSFGRCVDRCSAFGPRILSRGGRFVRIRGTCNSRLRCAQGIEVVSHTEKVPAKAKPRNERIKISGEEKQWQNWLKETNLGQAVEETTRCPNTRKAAEEKTGIIFRISPDKSTCRMRLYLPCSPSSSGRTRCPGGLKAKRQQL